VTDFIASIGFGDAPHHLNHMRRPNLAPGRLANQVLAQFNQRMGQPFLRAVAIQAVIFQPPE
jgi:hypothetical protein